MALTAGSIATDLASLPVESLGSQLTHVEWNAIVTWAKAAQGLLIVEPGGQKTVR